MSVLAVSRYAKLSGEREHQSPIVGIAATRTIAASTAARIAREWFEDSEPQGDVSAVGGLPMHGLANKFAFEWAGSDMASATLVCAMLGSSVRFHQRNAGTTVLIASAKAVLASDSSTDAPES